MAKFLKDRDIVQSIKIVDQLKNDLIESISRLFKSISSGKEETITDSLSSIILWSYLLSRRIGVSFHRLDRAVEQRARCLMNEGFEKDSPHKDVTAFLNYYYTHKSSGRDSGESDIN